MEKSSGAVFELQKGNVISAELEEDEMDRPFAFPVNLGNKVDNDAVADAASHAPAHELLACTICLQVIEWGIKTASLVEQ